MKSGMLAVALCCAVTVGNAAYTNLETRYLEVRRGIATEADRRYLQGLQDIEMQLMKAALPSAVLAVRQERERFQKAGNMAEGSNSDHRDVVALVSTLEGWKNDRMLDLLRSYCVRLEQLVGELTRSDNLNEAIKVEQRLKNAKNEMAFYEAGSASPDVQEAPPDDAPRPAQERVEQVARLMEVRLERFQVSAVDPVDAFNNFAVIIHPHNIALRLEAVKMPIASVHYDYRTGSPRFQRQRIAGQSSPLLSQPLVLNNTTALDVLQSICDLHGLGFAFDGNALIITDPGDPRSMWRRHSVTAEDMSQQLVAAPGEASALFRRDPIRVTGPIINLSRDLRGRATVVLHAPINIHIEMEHPLPNPDQWRSLEASIEQQRERVRRQSQVGGRPIRRIGEAVELTPPPSTGPYLLFSVVADFDAQSQRGIVLRNGRDARWQQVFQHPGR